jgi:hypothetical protein
MIVPVPTKRIVGCWLVAGGILAGCVTAEGSRSSAERTAGVGPVTIGLRATSYNAGQIGQAVLSP